MVKKVKRVLIFGVLALFTALAYAEGEQDSPKEGSVAVKEEKSKGSVGKEADGYSEIEQATRRGYSKRSRHGKKNTRKPANRLKTVKITPLDGKANLKKGRTKSIQ